jgi:uncharacterized damage-inducible protein DinB
MNLGDFVRLFDYDGWANGECLESFRIGGTVKGALRRMAHILSAEKLWWERLQRVPPSMPVWPASTLEECQSLANEMAAAWRKYLAGMPPDGLAERVDYRNSKGEVWESRVEDVLTHVIMHSAYHRGQIAMEMRAAGFEPAHTDFIHAVRQGLVGESGR